MVFSIKVCYADKEETFSQNYRTADVGKDLCRSSCPSPLLKQRSTRTGTQDFVQLHFENLQPFRQPVPVITLTVKHLLGKTDFKLNVFVCRTWLNLSATTVSPSSFIRYKDGYSEHTSGFIVFKNSEITKSYHTLRGKLTKEKRKPLSDSILILRDQRCALLSSTEIKWKKERKRKPKIYHGIITLIRVIIVHPHLVQMQKLYMLLLHVSLQQRSAHQFCIQDPLYRHWKFC